MPTPAYISALRRVYGQGLLLLPGVSAVVADGSAGAERVLLVRRSDNGQWEVPSGIVEPGEQPAAGLVREVLEETGVTVVAERLVLLTAGEDVTYPNGDLCQFVSLTFRCRYLSGEAHVANEESTEVGWFPCDALPELSPRHQRQIACALAPPGPTVFDA